MAIERSATQKWGGKLADRVNVAAAMGSGMETAVIKATRHDMKRPKEKHLRRLILYTQEAPGRNREMIGFLARRLESMEWNVVLKVLCVFHRLLRDGHSRFISDLKPKTNIFHYVRRFADSSSEGARQQSIYIRKYAQYLEEKVLIYKTLNVEFDKNPDVVKSYTIDECIERVPKLQSQLNALINCRTCRDKMNNQIIVFSFNMLIKDSFKLYGALNTGIITIIEHYFSLPKDKATKGMNFYKLFIRETEGMKQLIDISKQHSHASQALPELNSAPTGLVDALQQYIDDLESGAAPGSSNTAQNKINSAMKNQPAFQPNLIDGFEIDEEKVTENQSLFSAAPVANPSKSNSSFDPFADDLTQALPTSNDPFASPASNSSPFASPAPTNDPFATTNNDPFSNHPPKVAEQPFDPFAATAKPSQPTTSTPFDPFASAPPSQPTNSAPFDPFAPNGTTSQQPTSDPFASNNSSPFGAPSNNAASNPFGGGNDPFAAPPAKPAQSSNPFFA